MGSCVCVAAAARHGLTGVVRMQTAAEMFVMVLDVHKWVPLPAIAARAKQSSNAAVPAGMLTVHFLTHQCFSPFSGSTA